MTARYDSDSSNEKLLKRLSGNVTTVPSFGLLYGTSGEFSSEEDAKIAASTQVEASKLETACGKLPSTVYIGSTLVSTVTANHHAAREDTPSSGRSNDVCALREELCDCKRKLATYKTVVQKKDYDILVMQADIRQYRNKCKKMRTLAMAAIDRDDMIFERANSKLEEGVTETEVKSDNEDDKERNKVAYSYVDNELFLNEN